MLPVNGADGCIEVLGLRGSNAALPGCPTGPFARLEVLEGAKNCSTTEGRSGLITDLWTLPRDGLEKKSGEDELELSALFGAAGSTGKTSAICTSIKGP